MPLEIEKTEPKAKPFTMRLPLSLDAWVKDYARREGCSLAQVVEACVRMAKEDSEAKKK